MSFAIEIGEDDQPDTGHSIVIGTTPPEEPDEFPLLEFTVPTASLGALLLILIVRDGPVSCSDSTWKRVADGIGSGGVFLDAFLREVDGTEGSNAGDVISFLSPFAQELQGGMLTIRNALRRSLIREIQSGAFESDDSPMAPSVESKLVDDTIVCVWSAEGAVDISLPTGFRSIDTYSSSEFEERSIIIGARSADEIGTIGPGHATASEEVTGRAFTLALRFWPPLVPVEDAHAPAEIAAVDHVSEALSRLVTQLARAGS